MFQQTEEILRRSGALRLPGPRGRIPRQYVPHLSAVTAAETMQFEGAASRAGVKEQFRGAAPGVVHHLYSDPAAAGRVPLQFRGPAAGKVPLLLSGPAAARRVPLLLSGPATAGAKAQVSEAAAVDPAAAVQSGAVLLADKQLTI